MANRYARAVLPPMPDEEPAPAGDAGFDDAGFGVENPDDAPPGEPSPEVPLFNDGAGGLAPYAIGDAVALAVRDYMRSLPGDPLAKMEEGPRQQWMIGLIGTVDETFRRATVEIAAQGFSCVRVVLESVSVTGKGAAIKAKAAEPGAGHLLVDRIGHNLGLLVVDPDLFTAGRRATKEDAGQLALDL